MICFLLIKFCLILTFDTFVLAFSSMTMWFCNCDNYFGAVFTSKTLHHINTKPTLHFTQKKKKKKTSKKIVSTISFLFKYNEYYFYIISVFNCAFSWNGKLEVIVFCLILCTVVLMQITGIYFYFVSLYVLFEINQPYLFNLSLEKSFYLLSHSNHLPLESLLYSDMSF